MHPVVRDGIGERSFRDYLRADEVTRRAGGEFKQRPAVGAPDLADYGRIKAPATLVLTAAA
ncbi:hypothetical protein [Streptomyces sp. NPDC019224]|uniref:hypothetical protein n=1 Tax=Streptomyces sp. NPDC019224 TaxID=3154484 RepID=UPI0033D9523D